MVYELNNLSALLDTLVSLPKETGWVEFKSNNFHPENVGKYVSSLANSAMLEGKDLAYLVYGVADITHEILGTNIDFSMEKVGAEDFLFWLSKALEPRITVTPYKLEREGKKRLYSLC